MSIGILIIQIVIILGIAFLSYYFKEKGKNIATKEDIGKITTEIEKVKHEYSSKLESVKSVLSARLFTHQVRYQNEFNMLVRLSEKLYKFNTVWSKFEIIVELNKLDVNKAASANQAAKEMLTVMGALMEEYEAYKPFYPQKIYKSVSELHTLGWTKLILQAHKEKLIESSMQSKTIVDIVKNNIQSPDAEDISKTIERIYAAIRERVEYWEQLNIE